MHNAHPAYRPDIDGLRAVAILSVVIYHAFPANLRGGFVGVDVFFVISGFLISSILLKSLERGDFSFADFYARRVRRIFPALIAVLASSYVAGWFLLLPDEFKLLGKHMAAGAGFVQNVVLNREAGYFDTASELKPLMHLWSLSVEEQFYMVAPLALWIAWRLRVSLLLLIAALAFVSFGLNLADIQHHPARVFFLPHTRVWQLLAGAVLAYFHVFKPTAGARSRSVATNNALGIAGLSLILGAAFGLDKSTLYPGGWALLPTIGSCLLIFAGPAGWLNRTLLSSRPMVYVGLISYPLYLWHWPLLAFARIEKGATPSHLVLLAAVAMSFLLAEVTYRWIEIPLRAWDRPRIKTAVLVAVLGLVGFVGYNAFERNGLGFRVKDRQEFAQFFENDPPTMQYFTKHKVMEAYRAECNFFDVAAWMKGQATTISRPAIDPSCYTPKTEKKVFIWGDSHAQHLSPGLLSTLPADVSVMQVGTSACIPQLLDRIDGETDFCKKSTSFALEAISKTVPQIVVLAQMADHDEKNDFVAIVKHLKSLGISHVIVMGPVPKWEPWLYKVIVKDLWIRSPRRTFQGVVPGSLEVDRRLAEKYGAGAGGFEYLSLVGLLCNSEGCLTYIGDNRRDGIVTFDYGHLTLNASKYVAESLLAPVILKDLREAN